MEKREIEKNTVNASNQIKKEQSTFYIGPENAPQRMVIVGNSITRHGLAPDIGWNRICGMAASDEAHDYVHVLCRMLEENGKEVYTMVNQLSYWELHYREQILEHYKDIQDFKPDIFVFRLGENIWGERFDPSLKTALDEMLDFFCAPTTKIILTTGFWLNAQVDDIIKRVAQERDLDVVLLGDLGELPEMKAHGLFEHGGVANHPGDKGMALIAQRVFDAIMN